MLTFLVIVAVLLLITISLSVYYRRRGSHTNLIFMFLTLALAGWALTNYIAITVPQDSNTIYAIRLVLFFVVIQNTLFYFFARTFPSTKLRDLPVKNKVIGIYSTIVAVLILTPAIFASVTITGGKANPNPRPFILLFVVHALITIVGGLAQLFIKYRASKGLAKRQLLYILSASIILWTIVPITNFVITLFAKTTIFVKFSPFYTLIFGIFITYAIVAQKLFDIRAAVARSITYALILFTIVAIYGIGLFGIIDAVVESPGLRQFLSLVLVVIVTTTFPAIKRFFDRVTNRLFYRDAYDPQTVLNDLGSIMVAEIDLQRILRGTRQILISNFKASFVEFVLMDNERLSIKAPHNRHIEQGSEIITPVLANQHKEILEQELLGRLHPAKNIFNEYGIGVSLRLKTQQHTVGYILFGGKLSGDVYNAQDIKLMYIVANELAVTIQNALRFEEIKRFNATLEQKVEDATKKLRHANIRLKELDKTKDEFISMASHQLRTPLTTIKGYLSMILEGDVGKVKAQEKDMIQQAFDSAQNMVDLIADLLNISRLQSGKFVLENTPTNLDDMIELEIKKLSEQATSRKITLSYDRPASIPILSLDETKMRQVVMNFIDNALYYTPAGGAVTVRLAATTDSVTYTVTDTGVGVPKEAQHHLFSKFYRADNAKRMRPDGTGLGLFMARKVIVAQGGAIIFKSTEGQGSTFGFSFPRRTTEFKK